MLQVALSRVEVMLVFPTIVSSVVLLNYFALFVEEFALFILHFGLFLIHELATADVSTPYSLNFESSPLFIVILPLNLKHSPVLLDYDSSCIFLISILLGMLSELGQTLFLVLFG